MKTFLALTLILTVAEARAQARCNRPTDPNKVVLMLSFHDGAEEERGAREAACARGETLVVIPRPSPDAARVRPRIVALERQLSAAWEGCNNGTSCARMEEQMAPLVAEYERLQNSIKPDYQGQLRNFLQSSQANRTKVSSLILSGHDGGGSYYGDYGETDIAEISQIVQDHQGAFADTSTLLLMGCWTSTPDQVEQWRAIFPQMRVLGGFVGSAPRSTRAAAGTYVSGLLRGERNLPQNASRAQVQAMINTVQHLNMVTAGVFINPICDDESQGRSPAYFYVSPANSGEEIPQDMRPGLNLLPSVDARDLACRRAFGGEGVRGTFDWNAIMQYYQGHREPENNQELRGLYSFLRNNSHCFSEGSVESPVDPDQVLFLRFFQDTKKNIGKYFREDLASMYRTLDALVAESSDVQLRTAYQNHVKLMGEGLTNMSRQDTIAQISKLQGIYDRIYSSRTERTDRDQQVQRTMQAIDKHLYRLQCMPPTWHDYSDGETLSPPTC